MYNSVHLLFGEGKMEGQTRRVRSRRELEGRATDSMAIHGHRSSTLSLDLMLLSLDLKLLSLDLKLLSLDLKLLPLDLRVC